MPEDDSEAMYHICATLHLQYNKLPKTWSVAQLLEVAKLADKYAIQAALKPHIFNWCARCATQKLEFSDLLELLAVAVVFEECATVASIGGRVLKEATQPIQVPEGELPISTDGLFGESNADA